jgi:DNA-binding CsgD family transcriptional regulator
VRAEPAATLSEQERNVLRLFAEGKDSDEVASTLSISPQTLRNHLHHINQKLRTHNRLEAVMNAIQRKLI